MTQDSSQQSLYQTNTAPTRLDAHRMKQNAAIAAQLLKTLGNEYRLLILCVLSEGEFSVGELNARVELSQSSLSQHLAVLRQQGLVTTRREAQTIFYQLAESPALHIIHLLHQIFCEAESC